MVAEINKLRSHKDIASVYIGLAAMMWGTIAIFGKLMMNQGVSPEVTGCVKLLGSSAVMFIYFLKDGLKALRVRWEDIGWLLAMAFFSQTVFNFSYYPVVASMGVTKAGVLLYTMPIFLTIWSVLIFHEKMTGQKLAGILLCFTGSVLAITGGHMELDGFTIGGIGLGLLAAVAFSLVSVFSKILLKKMPPLTVIFYAFLFGGLMMVPFIDFSTSMEALMTPVSLSSALGLACIGSVLPYIIYFKGIDMGVNLSKAGVISVIELITSILLASLFFGEVLTGIKFFGVLLIVISIVLIQYKRQ